MKTNDKLYFACPVCTNELKISPAPPPNPSRVSDFPGVGGSLGHLHFHSVQLFRNGDLATQSRPGKIAYKSSLKTIFEVWKNSIGVCFPVCGGSTDPPPHTNCHYCTLNCTSEKGRHPFHRNDTHTPHNISAVRSLVHKYEYVKKNIYIYCIYNVNNTLEIIIKHK